MAASASTDQPTRRARNWRGGPGTAGSAKSSDVAASPHAERAAHERAGELLRGIGSVEQKEGWLDELQLEELIGVRTGLRQVDAGVEQLVRREPGGIAGGGEHSVCKAARGVAR